MSLTRLCEGIYPSQGAPVPHNSMYTKITDLVFDYRAREDELLYVLRKILELRLWPGTLWAALSDAPSSHCVEQPGECSMIPIAVHTLNILAPML